MCVAAIIVRSSLWNWCETVMQDHILQRTKLCYSAVITVSVMYLLYSPFIRLCDYMCVSQKTCFCLHHCRFICSTVASMSDIHLGQDVSRHFLCTLPPYYLCFAFIFVNFSHPFADLCLCVFHSLTHSVSYSLSQSVTQSLSLSLSLSNGINVSSVSSLWVQ